VVVNIIHKTNKNMVEEEREELHGLRVIHSGCGTRKCDHRIGPQYHHSIEDYF
jgi:hypothetical protein